MNKRAKNLILIGSFLSFFILSYLIVLYAYGYQFDFKNLKWIETGGLLVKANIDGVKVYIDGQLKGKTSFLSNTFVEKNLLPGKYELKFQKEGFSILNKIIEIKSGEASQLANLYLAGVEEINGFIENSKPIGSTGSSQVKENPNYFISKTDGLLYREFENEKIEKISSESVYIKNFSLKILDENVYLASRDSKAPGVFLLDSKGRWLEIHSLPANDLILSPDNRKLAVVGPNEITVLWLKDDNGPPYFRKNHKELVLKIGEKIKEASWFKTGWHLVYLTESGKTYFVEVDGTGGRNEARI